MNKAHYFTIFAFIILLVSTFLFAKTKETEADDELTSPSAFLASDSTGFNPDEYINNFKSTLDKQTFLTLNGLEKEDDNVESLDQLIFIYDSLSRFDISAIYQLKKAETTNNVDDWQTAGDRFTGIFVIPEVQDGLRNYCVASAIKCYGEILEQTPDNLDIQAKLANCYMDGSGEVMTGVQMLLSVVETDENHIRANLLLGKYGIISGQFDKAILRLEKVISLQPENAEALFLLAEVYKNSGNNIKAIEYLEQCRDLMDDEAFKLDIDNHIKHLENTI